MKDTYSCLILFPNQLYEGITDNNVFLVEEHAYYRDMRFHKLKLAYMRACGKYYTDTHSFEYVDCANVPKQLQQIKKQFKTITIIDPIDHAVVEKYKRLFGRKLVMRSSDEYGMFLLKDNDIIELKNKYALSKVILHVWFFNEVKKRLHILEDVKSTDKDNRKSLPATYNPQPITQRTVYARDNIYHYYEESKTYIMNHTAFKNNPGELDHMERLPITKEDAKRHFKTWMDTKFDKFGDYQDAIHDVDPFVYHAHISYLLNIGLISPEYVLQECLKRQTSVPINALEGFIRQLVGWREYMRFIYVVYLEGTVLHRKKHVRLPIEWYEGTTGVTPIDKEIDKVKKYAWANHIVRLMVFLNIFKLNTFSYDAIYTWFMEMCALDAYDWVMASNLTAMGLYSHSQSQPRFMRKQYVSSSKYILKMSNYKKGDWAPHWDSLYRRYTAAHNIWNTEKNF